MVILLPFEIWIPEILLFGFGFLKIYDLLLVLSDISSVGEWRPYFMVSSEAS